MANFTLEIGFWITLLIYLRGRINEQQKGYKQKY